MKDAKTPSGGARVSEIPIRKHGSTGRPRETRRRCVGFGIWPFSEGWPRVVEIYPRALTGPVNKSRWSARHDHLLEHFPEQPRDLLERAAGSEDAFDAAVSALVMSEHEAELRALGPPADPAELVEGRIWRPQ